MEKETEELLQALYCLAEEQREAGTLSLPGRGLGEGRSPSERSGRAPQTPPCPVGLPEGERGLSATDALSRAGVSEAALRAAVAAGLVVQDATGLRLSAAGQAAAAGVVRRHRLAERLLRDVLRVSDAASEEAACEFEHSLETEVTESICTLLGHPRVCPHGKPIPPGACCNSRRRAIAPLVEPLAQLPTGASGVLAYIHTRKPQRLERLTSFGLVPGTAVHVHQTWPSLVISLGETHLALDRETAEDIYIRCAAAT